MGVMQDVAVGLRSFTRAEAFHASAVNGTQLLLRVIARATRRTLELHTGRSHRLLHVSDIALQQDNTNLRLPLHTAIPDSGTH